MRVPILRNGATIATIRPQNGRLTHRLLGVNIITFNLTLAEPFEFSIGDYLTFEDERYTMNIIPAVKKHSRYRYEYGLTFEAPQYQLRNAQYLFFGETDDLARNGMAEFSLVAEPRRFVELVVANGNRIGGSWQVGRCIEAEAREVAFNGDNCLSTLQRLAQEFDTEFYFEGNTIHFEPKASTLPYVFMYGKGNTLYDIERVMKDTNICTRLYAFGSERNLPFGYRNGAARLKTGSSCYEQNADLYGVIEHTQTFDDVYPHREGAVTGVDATNPAVFMDKDMPFDLSEKNTDGSASVYKYLLPGAKAKVKFNTGDLAGYEFELAAYTHRTAATGGIAGKFTITPINEKFSNPDASLPGTFALPNDALKPRVGDRYVLFDISLPQAYVDAAEAELEQKAGEYLAENSVPQTEYTVTPNEIEFTRHQLRLELGATVRLIDAPLGIDKAIRIVGFERSLDNIYRYSNVSLADAPANALAERKYAAYVQQKQIDGSTNLAAIANRRSSIIEDVTANYTTDIDGGLILTTLIQLRGLEADGSLKTNAGVSGLTNEVNPVRFWAGSDFDGRNDAPYRVRHDGSVAMSRASLSTNDSGKRIEISSAEGKLELFDSNNVSRVEINDGEGTDNSGNTVKSGVITVKRTSGSNAGAVNIGMMGIEMTEIGGRKLYADGGLINLIGVASGSYARPEIIISAGAGVANFTITRLPDSSAGLPSGRIFKKSQSDGTSILYIKD